MKYRVVYLSAVECQVEDDDGNVYIHGLWPERAREIVDAWNEQDYPGIDNE